MNDLFSYPVDKLRGVGGKRAAALKRLGILTAEDLLRHYPRSYQDRTDVRPLGEAEAGTVFACAAAVCAGMKSQRVPNGLTVQTCRAADLTGEVDLVFFNQPYLTDVFKEGCRFLLYGKAEYITGKATQTRRGGRLRMTAPRWERISSLPEPGAAPPEARLVPVYPLSEGVSGNFIENLIRQLFPALAEMRDPLPEWLRKDYCLCNISEALREIHRPSSREALAAAKRRLAFEECFLLQLGLRLLSSLRAAGEGERLEPASEAEWAAFYAALPFTPTRAQARVIAECAADMTRGEGGAAMSRLVQGDVGSGKTVVAAALVWIAAKNGYQSALMAPTEILAAQHYRTLREIFAKLGISCALLTASAEEAPSVSDWESIKTRPKRRARLLAGLKSGEIDFVVGTHALLGGSVEFAKLGFVTADEQHRFGVEQRSGFFGKGRNPHMLVMSATPIPRTLALIIYGDLSVSIIDELPPMRKPVKTYLVDSSYRPRLCAFIKKLAEEGRQCYVVCPLVEAEEDGLIEGDAGGESGPMSVEDCLKSLREALPELRSEMVYGSMPAKKKEAVMAAFSNKPPDGRPVDILVSTTVVEVGVDNPNAALMVIENAERFGLSQLHQLRGRVGRGSHRSYCVAVSDAAGEPAVSRLNAFCSTTDGFKIAEADLEQRGPGDFIGRRQHGLPELKMAASLTDMRLLAEARNAAGDLLARDGRLSEPENAALLAAVKRFFDAAGGVGIIS